MAGPCASLLLPHPLSDAQIADIRDAIDRLADPVEGDDFWIEKRPFFISWGADCTGALDEIRDSGLPSLLGWSPRAAILFGAMCNGDIDHRILALLCYRFGCMLDGIVDFGGTLVPFLELDETAASEPVRMERPLEVAGVLFARSYQYGDGQYATCHYGDMPFLEAWLKHPDFRMVK